MSERLDTDTVVDGRYRCPNSQQGYSPFSTWTRGLAWALTGFAEQQWILALRYAESSSYGDDRPGGFTGGKKVRIGGGVHPGVMGGAG